MGGIIHIVRLQVQGKSGMKIHKKLFFCKGLHLFSVLLFFSFQIISCGVGKKPDLPEFSEEKLPPAYGLIEHRDAIRFLSAEAWWEGFGSPELSRLIEEAFENNHNILEAAARLDAAAASLVSARSSLWPSLSFDAEAGHQHTKNSETGRRQSSERYHALLAASYEVDVWGRVSALTAAEAARFRASAEDLDSLSMTIAATVAETWVLRVQTLGLISLVKRQSQEEDALWSIQQGRFSNGLASAMDVMAQREVLLALQARLTELQATQRLQAHTLALLTGKSAGTLMLEEENLDKLSMPALPDPGLPIELIEKRPDIRSAYQSLLAAGWEKEAAKAARLPALTLSAKGGLTAASFSLLGEGWLLDAAAGLALPLFDAGKRKAEVAEKEALLMEKATAYERIVLTAVKEVLDALTLEERQKMLLEESALRLEAAYATLEQALHRYRWGSDNFDTVLSARSRIRDLEELLLAQKVGLAGARISLYRALGGDWIKRNADQDGAGEPLVEDLAIVE